MEEVRCFNIIDEFLSKPEILQKLNEEKLKEVRNAINRELYRRGNIGKVYQDPKKPHRVRWFYFLDVDTFHKFVAKYEDYFMSKPDNYTWAANYNCGFRAFYPEPDEWAGKVSVDVNMDEFNDIKSNFKIHKFVYMKTRKIDGKQYNAAPDVTYIVEGEIK